MTSRRTVLKSATALGAAGLFSGLATPARADLEATFAKFDPDSTRTVDNSAFAEVLGRYLTMSDSGVTLLAYGAVTKADRDLLKDYTRALQATDVTALNRDEQFAFWANLYNAVTVELILDRYPVDSIRDITNGWFSIGPWKIDLMKMQGVDLSLDDVEHNILREFWDDNRVHYAVNCASIGCPNLYAEPFEGATLDATLTKNAKAYINHPRGVEVRENGGLHASRIYSWFKGDFGGSEASTIEHFRKYADAELLEKLDGRDSIGGYQYDWSLNEPKG